MKAVVEFKDGRLFVADGWVEGHRTRILQKAVYRPVLQRIVDNLGGSLGSDRTVSRFGKQYSYVTAELKLPPIVKLGAFLLEEIDLRHFWRGLFDGDGSWPVPSSGRSQRAVFCLSQLEPTVAAGFRCFCRKFRYNPTHSAVGRADRWQFGVADTRRLAQQLYVGSSISLQHKLEGALRAC